MDWNRQLFDPKGLPLPGLTYVGHTLLAGGVSSAALAEEAARLMGLPSSTPIDLYEQVQQQEGQVEDAIAAQNRWEIYMCKTDVQASHIVGKMHSVWPSMLYLGTSGEAIVLFHGVMMSTDRIAVFTVPPKIPVVSALFMLTQCFLALCFCLCSLWFVDFEAFLLSVVGRCLVRALSRCPRRSRRGHGHGRSLAVNKNTCCATLTPPL